MLHHIRPYKIFSALDAEGPDRLVTVRLSKRRGIAMHIQNKEDGSDEPDHSLTYLETMILLCAAKIVKCEMAFEFGTHLGATTTNLALNLPKSQIYTADLAPIGNFKEWEEFSWLRNIKAYQMDTQTENFCLLHGVFDLIWVDGCPDRSGDSYTALELLNPNKLSCIGWHDYGIPQDPNDPYCANTTSVIEKLAEDYTLYHILESKTVLYFNEPMPQLLG